MKNSLNNYFLIDIELKQAPYSARGFETSIIDTKGVNMTVNRDFNKNEYNNQVGTIVYVPNVINNELLQVALEEYFIKDFQIKEGDKAYFHHLASDKVNAVNINGKILYRQKYEQIYAIERNGVVYPIERKLFIRPIMEDETDIIKNGILIKLHPEKKQSLGQIVWSSNYCTKLGLEKGTKVLYSRIAEYELAYSNPVVYITNPNYIYGILN